MKTKLKLKTRKVTEQNKNPPWKVIIADDDDDVFTITKSALSGLEVDERPLKLLKASSGQETITTMIKNPDTALILLDVVMETEHAGLEVVEFIRKRMKNKNVQIVIRTGQAGKDTPEEVSAKYNIFLFADKGNLIREFIRTIVISGIKAHKTSVTIQHHVDTIEKQLTTIERSKKALIHIIRSSDALMKARNIKEFTLGTIMQLSALLQYEEGTLFYKPGFAINDSSGLAAMNSGNGSFRVLTGNGAYNDCINCNLEDIVQQPEILQAFDRAIREKKSLVSRNVYIGYFSTNSNEYLLFLTGRDFPRYKDQELLAVFEKYIGIILDNHHLNQRIMKSQEEMLFTIGNLVYQRDELTYNHMKRTSELTYRLAILYGLEEARAYEISIASVMHDVGKVSLPDSILNHPGIYNDAEREQMKEHTRTGSEIFRENALARNIALYHHERWDGRGYPDGLSREDIPLEARIVKVTDVYDALKSRRKYKDPITDKEELRTELSKDRGTHFDPIIIDLFLEHFDEFLEISNKYPDQV